MKSLQSMLGLLLLSCMVIADSRHNNYDHGRRPFHDHRRPSFGSGPETGSSCNIVFNSIQEQEEYNRRVVLQFYDKAFGDLEFQEAADKYISPVEYIQHNPTVADGSPAFVAFWTVAFQGIQSNKIEIKRSTADGDLVWVHLKMAIKGVNYAIVDIFRLSCGKIVEHWDVIQEIGNGPFPNAHPFF